MRIHRYAFRHVAVLAIALTVSACSAATVKGPNGQPRGTSGQIANYGLKVAQTIGQAQTAAVKLQEAAPAAFPAAKAIQFQTVIKESSDYGQQLAAVLRVIQTAEDAKAAISAADLATARDLIDKITADMLKASGVVGSEGNTTSEVQSLLNAVLQTTNTILTELGRSIAV